MPIVNNSVLYTWKVKTVPWLAKTKENLHTAMKTQHSQKQIHFLKNNAPNIGALQYVRQMLRSMKGEIKNNTIIVGDFNKLLRPMHRSTKQKINKKTQTLNDTIDQLDLVDIYRTFHPKTMSLTFFSQAH